MAEYDQPLWSLLSYVIFLTWTCVQHMSLTHIHGVVTLKSVNWSEFTMNTCQHTQVCAFNRKKPLAKHRYRLVDNIKTNIIETWWKGTDYINWLVFVNTVWNFGFSKMQGTYIHTYITHIHTYTHTYISSIHNIPQGAFGYETLSNEKYINDNWPLLRTIQDTTENSVKYYIHNILILILRGPNWSPIRILIIKKFF